MELGWLPAMLVVSVAATTLVESLISTVRSHLPDRGFVNARFALKPHIEVTKPK